MTTICSFQRNQLIPGVPESVLIQAENSAQVLKCTLMLAGGGGGGGTPGQALGHFSATKLICSGRRLPQLLIEKGLCCILRGKVCQFTFVNKCPVRRSESSHTSNSRSVMLPAVAERTSVSLINHFLSRRLSQPRNDGNLSVYVYWVQTDNSLLARGRRSFIMRGGGTVPPNPNNLTNFGL
jgi:hypothetical protein